MNNTKRLLACAGVLIIAFSTAVFAAPEKDKKAEKPQAADTQNKGTLKVERDGAKVTLTWTLPEGEWTGIDVLRNGKSAPKGRQKLKYIRATAGSYVDTLPEAGDQYWYWLKVADKNKNSINIGPVQAK